MEQQLYRVKVRRIRWQVAEACTNSLDRLFHTSDLVEPLVKRRNDFIQREVRYLADEGENLPRVLLQWRSTPSTGHGFESPVFTKALHPPDRRTDADIKLFGRLTSGSSFFHE